MDKILHLSTLLQCPPDEAFAFFTASNRLQSWLAPLANVEPVTGGLYELFWAPDDRENDSTIGCRITALEPDQFIAFEWRSPRQFKHFANTADPLTHVVLFFIPLHGGTQVHLIHSGWRSSPEWEQARAWQQRAWDLAFHQLELQANGKGG